MDSKKPFFLDHLVSSLSLKWRLLSGCGLGLLASLLLLYLLSTLNTTPSPFTVTSSSSSSFFSWVFSIPASSPSNSSSSSSSNSPYFFNSSGLATVRPASERTLDGNSSSNCFSGKELELGNAHLEYSSSLAPQEPISSRTNDGSGEQAFVENVHSTNITSKDVGVRNVSKKAMEEDCNIFNGRWVRDEREAFYPAGSCPYIDNDFNCYKNGRPDDELLKWRWQPTDCDIQRMNATDFLARLKGKRLLFVGDSLNRNMWESLVCILHHSVERKERVYEASGHHEFKTKGYYSFRFEDHNCSIDFVRSPFLVREVIFKNVSGSNDERLRLDLLDETTSAYREADIVVFNTGHWWTHEKTSRGVDYYQEGDHVYPLLKVMKAYEKALTSWARWVDKNINSSKTQVVFRGYSLTHFRGGQWNSGGQCHKETEPIFNETFLVKYPLKMRAFERVMEQMKTPIIYLNISRLTDYRKDGHPSIYRKTYSTVQEHLAAESSQDCSHWCLPGVPDTWNELLYASLLRNGKGSWAHRVI